MPRAEPLNEKIIQGLKSRKRRAELLGQQKQFQYGRAIQLITEFRGNITKDSQLAKLCGEGKIIKPIYDEITAIMYDRADVEVPEPSPAEQARAAARGPVEQRLPTLGTGAAAILLVLYRESLKPNGARFMTKDQLRERATRDLHVNMYDETGGFSKWKGIESLEVKRWVHRDPYSEMTGGPGSGRFGGREDEFSITDEGKAAAARLETLFSRQPGGLAGALHNPSRAAAAARGGYRGAGTGGFDNPSPDAADAEADGDDPFAALLSGFLTGPEFTGGRASAAAARLHTPASAAAHAAVPGGSPFTGRGHVLGGGRGNSGRPGAGVAAVTPGAAGDAGYDSDYLLGADSEGLDADGFQVYRPEWFEDDNSSSLPAAQQRDGLPGQQPSSRHGDTRPSTAGAAAARAPTAAPPAARPASYSAPAGGSTTGALNGRMPRVRMCDKPEPLCSRDSGCAPCKMLHELLEETWALTLPMMLTKKQQQHVQQTVAHLVSPEGGQWSLTATTEDKTVTIRKQHGGSAHNSRPPASATKDPLAEHAKKLAFGNKPQLQGQPQQKQPAVATQPTAQSRALKHVPTQPSPAAPAAHLSHSRPGSAQKRKPQQLTPAQMAAAAAEARARQQQQHDMQHHRPLQQQQQQQPVEQPIPLESQLDELMPDIEPVQPALSRRRKQPADPEQVDWLLVDSQDAFGYMGFLADAAVEGSRAHKRRRQQGAQAQDSTADEHIQYPAAAAAAEFLGGSPKREFAAMYDQHNARTPERKRQQTSTHPQQQQQGGRECISLVESQDVDADLLGPAAGLGSRGGLQQTSWLNTAAQGHTRDSSHARASGLHQTAAAKAGSSSRGRKLELKLVVDDKERHTDSAPNQVYQYMRQDCRMLLDPLLPRNIKVDVDRDELPLGDYAWLLLEDNTSGAGSSGQAAAAAATAAAGSEDGNSSDDEAAAATERDRCVVGGAVVERKVIRDIVGRSAGGDHILQLQRMYQFRDAIPYQLLVIENLTNLAASYTVYSRRGSSQSHTAIYDEATLFDFIIRAAVSSYGSQQKILLAPSPEDTRNILVAVTQLLVHDLQHNSEYRSGPQQQRFGQQAEQQGAAAGVLTYPELKRQVNQVNRRLPRWELPAELSYPGAADVVPPDTAFQVTSIEGDFTGLKIYSHKTYKGSNHLHIVYVQGRQLLQLLDTFYKQALAEAGPAQSAQLSVVQAVDVALWMGVLLASFLDASVSDAATNIGMTPQATAAAADSSTSVSGCRVLLVENLFGPHGALTYMAQAQQAAAFGSRPATKRAAEQQAQMCRLDGGATKQHIWLWLVCFVLKQQWHVQLCQSSASVGLFLQTAGSRCYCFAKHLQPQGGIGGEQRQGQQLSQQQQGLLQQQQKEPEPAVVDSEEEETDGELDMAYLQPAAAATLAPGYERSAVASRQKKSSGEAHSRGTDFAAWLDELIRSDGAEHAAGPAGAGSYEQTGQQQHINGFTALAEDVIVID